MEERKLYIGTVQYLKNRVPQTSPDNVAGIGARFEDFLLAHTINADNVHLVL
jgi:hypothetical protein